VNAAQRKQIAAFFRQYGKEVPRERIISEAYEKFSEFHLLEAEANQIYGEVFPKQDEPTATESKQTQENGFQEYTAEEIASFSQEGPSPQNTEQPKPEPETGKFRAIAERSITRGENRILPIAVGGKNPAIKWKDSAVDTASTEEWAALVPGWIDELSQKFPELNGCVIAKPDEHLFIDCDTTAEFIAGYEQFSGEKFPETYTTSARANRTQMHFKQTDRTRPMGNVHQFQVDGIDFSVRQHNLYVLAEGSRHPSGSIYKIVTDAPIVPMPDKMVEYIQHLKQKAANINQPNHIDNGTAPRGSTGLIPHGKIHPWMVSIAGGLRSKGLTPEEIEPILLRQVHENCEPPIDDRKVKQVARSMTNYQGTVPQPVIFGEQVPGQPPNPEAPPDNWLNQFRSVDEMEDGPIVMVINGVLQEGICFIGANPGDGKTWVALAFAKAISTGTPLFDLPQYDVPEPRTVIYLIPESRDRAFRKRCGAFEMPKDKMKFMTRTISAGAPLQLSDPNLLEAVRQTKAVVFLDTAARFMRGTDENAAAQNRLLVNDVVALLAAGATTVVLVHHATKEAKQKKMAMTLENMLRGSSDLGAMCDQAYGIRKDMGLYANGGGPMEIDLVDLKDREDVGTLTSIRLAASYKKPGSIFPVSYINEKHNFQVVDDTAAFKRKVDSLVAMVTQDPDLPEKELAEQTGLSTYTVKHYLNGRGFHRVQGGRGGASPWHQDNGQPCPHEKAKKGSSGINLDSPEKRPKPVVN